VPFGFAPARGNYASKYESSDPTERNGSFADERFVPGHGARGHPPAVIPPMLWIAGTTSHPNLKTRPRYSIQLLLVVAEVLIFPGCSRRPLTRQTMAVATLVSRRSGAARREGSDADV
jgi:hypothetical protein